MRRFYRDWVKNFMERLGMSEGVPIESRMVTRAIERAQKKVEDYNFEIRKSLLDYDDVMDQQRKTIYSVRQSVLEGTGLRERAEEFIAASIARAGEAHKGDYDGFAGWFQRTFGVLPEREAVLAAIEKDPNTEPAVEQIAKLYEERDKVLGPELMRRVEQYILLNAVDSRWKDHLHAVDSLKTGIGLRGYGQLDPKNEYKREGFALFQSLLAAIEDEVTSLLLRIRVNVEPPPQPAAASDAASATSPASTSTPASAPPIPQRPSPAAASPNGASQAPTAPPRRPISTPASIPATHAFDLKRRQDAIKRAQEIERAKTSTGGDGNGQPQAATPVKAVPKADRNAPCPCGSGKKYKKCHGAAE